MMIIFIVIMQFFGAALATERPIIGILTEEFTPKESGFRAHSFIAASYVKAVEQSGARVVPIFINRTKTYYSNILDAVNGVVFPGGGVNFNASGGYGEAGKIIVDYAKKVNKRGDNFPILGVCLGLEFLLYSEVDNYGILDSCNSSNVALPLIFKKKIKQSSLYQQAPPDVLEILSTLPVTYNHHSKCVTEQLLSQYNLTGDWRVLTTNYDLNGKEFISSIEHRDFPIVGIQFHPEKNAFEWCPVADFNHSRKAIYSARLFYDWLVAEARKNNHSFENHEKESNALIYNFAPTFLGKGEGYYQQVYYFK